MINLKNTSSLIFLQTFIGPILESKGMCAISQKKGKNGKNIWTLGQKCTKFENIVKKGCFMQLSCDMHEKAYAWKN